MLMPIVKKNKAENLRHTSVAVREQKCGSEENVYVVYTNYNIDALSWKGYHIETMTGRAYSKKLQHWYPVFLNILFPCGLFGNPHTVRKKTLAVKNFGE